MKYGVVQRLWVDRIRPVPRQASGSRTSARGWQIAQLMSQISFFRIPTYRESRRYPDQNEVKIKLLDLREPSARAPCPLILPLDQTIIILFPRYRGGAIAGSRRLTRY